MPMPSDSRSTVQPPPWVDRTLYPFTGYFFAHPHGRMHYLDEGDGAPVVLVHGTPTWSFLYRHVARALAPRHRVVAPDHLGFGLSDKPDGAPYRPADHAERLVALLDALDLTRVTLVLHDFGGPIGLAAAFARPQRIARLVLMNTFLWPVDDDPAIVRGARVAGSGFGRLLYRYLNFPVKALMPQAVADRRTLTPAVRQHYAAPLGTPAQRNAAWEFARALLGERAWYEDLWARRATLGGWPTLLLWGMKDPTFGPAYLARWQRELPHARSCEIGRSGHFVPEEAPEEVATEIGSFLDAPAALATASA